MTNLSGHLPDEYAALIQQSESARAEKKIVDQPKQSAGVSRRTRVVICAVVGAVAFISAIIAGMREDGAAHDKNKAAHKELERTTAEWLADHPGQTPSFSGQDFFEREGYEFHRKPNGTYELWRHGRPVAP